MKSHQIFFKCYRCKIRTCVYYNDSNYDVDSTLAAQKLKLSHLGAYAKSRGDNDEMEKKKQYENYSRRELGGPSGFEGKKKAEIEG